jgi:uncharacterized protein YjbI with pentapeptide repeats
MSAAQTEAQVEPQTIHVRCEVTIKKEPREPGILSWFSDRKEAIGVLLLIVSGVIGGLWAFVRYVREEEDKGAFQRKALLVQFYGDLSDKTKRNTAAYALATLSGQAALPVLVPKLQEVAQFENDPSFLNALDQSLILIGDPAFKEVLRLNRDITSGGSGDWGTDRNRAILASIQPVILYSLRHRNSSDSQDYARLVWLDPSLDYADLRNLDLHLDNFEKGNLCGADLKGVNLEDATLYKVQLGRTHLDGANLTGAKLRYSNLEGAKLNAVIAKKTEFPDQLGYLKFDDAVLLDVDFAGKHLNRASFARAQLRGSNFLSADLEGVNFSGADLQNVKFSRGDNDNPRFPPHFALALGESEGSGAFVRNANFQNASNLDGSMKQYLCKWGAQHVPGGCADIPQIPNILAIERTDLLFGGGGCF